MIPNNLNSAIHLLHSTNSLFVFYKQTISYKDGLFSDSCYINHIFIENNMIKINFPDPCDIITNITVTNNCKFVVLSNGCNINSNIINLNSHKKVQLIIYNITNFDDVVVNFDVYLIKNKLKSAL